MHKLKCINLKPYRSTKEMQRRKRRLVSRASSRKKTFTQDQKELLGEKIEGTRTRNLKDSFAGKANPVHLTLTAIGLIVLFFLYIVWMLSDPPMSPVISKILDILLLLLAGILAFACLGLLGAGIIGSFFLFTRLLKRSPNLRVFRAGSPDTSVKNKE
ncbi:hypothetical protein F4Y59_14200 [Candidatus Poribacteria bacterium]|nr:hypothetical protein [Candidatus Poribacteria bacterium]MYK18590.1 hypothetical protein [Candidatus Poribacteria bacterium]